MAKKLDNPILLPDGTRVVEGLKVFIKNIRSTTDREWALKYPKTYIQSHSGRNRLGFTEKTVVRVNEGAGSRSFVVRSKNNCEDTYSIRKGCLTDVFGTKEAALEAVKAQLKSDIKKLLESNKFHMHEIKARGRKIARNSRTAKKLMKVKPKLELCDC